MNGEPLNKFFGEPWDAPALNGLTQGDTPVGRCCYYCAEEIVFGDRGFWRMIYGLSAATIEPVHRECDFRSVVGSVGHILEQCSCYGGDEEDPPGMTLREAAIAAWDIYPLKWSSA